MVLTTQLTLSLTLTIALTLMVTVNGNSNPKNPTTKYRCEFVNLNRIFATTLKQYQGLYRLRDIDREIGDLAKGLRSQPFRQIDSRGISGNDSRDFSRNPILPVRLSMTVYRLGSEAQFTLCTAPWRRTSTHARGHTKHDRSVQHTTHYIKLHCLICTLPTHIFPIQADDGNGGGGVPSTEQGSYRSPTS